MTDEDKKLVFEYCEWKMPCNGHEANAEACINEGDTCIKCEFYHPLDGNDMVAAMNKMDEKKEFHRFALFAYQKSNNTAFKTGNYRNEPYYSEFFIIWLMQPARFFELMVKWRKKKDA